MLEWLQGQVGPLLVAVKMYNLQMSGAAAAYETEKLAYNTLPELQGQAILEFICSGRLLHTGVPVIVTRLAGASLPEGHRVPHHLHKHLRSALAALHKAGVAHGDLRCSNFLLEGKKVRLADLGRAVLHASQEELNSEKKQLFSILGS